MSNKKNKKSVVNEKKKSRFNEKERLSEQELEEIEKEIEKEFSGVEERSQEEESSYQEQYMRLYAEFENYRKRIAKEQKDRLMQSAKRVLLLLIPLLDDFTLAIEHAKKTEGKKVLEGVELIYKKLFQLMQTQGLQEMQVAEGDAFDVKHHEALATLPAENEGKKEKIAQVVNKGYLLDGQVLRFAKVIVYI